MLTNSRDDLFLLVPNTTCMSNSLSALGCGRASKIGMVQKRVTAQGWLGSTPEGQRPQIRGLRAGGSLAVASSIPATQLSSPARLAERVVTPHAPMTLGANHVSRAPERG